MRKSLGLKLRFEIFKRDGFCCRYCGSTPPSVVLEVDHIVPVAGGGTNDPENLATSCFDCNRGKRDHPLQEAIPQPVFNPTIETERLKQAKAYSAHLVAVQKSRDEIFRTISDHWLRLKGEDCDEFVLGGEAANAIRKFQKQLSAQEIMEAIEIAHSKMGRRSEYQMLRYFCGVCWRKIREREA